MENLSTTLRIILCLLPGSKHQRKIIVFIFSIFMNRKEMGENVRCRLNSVATNLNRSVMNYASGKRLLEE